MRPSAPLAVIVTSLSVFGCGGRDAEPTPPAPVAETPGVDPGVDSAAGPAPTALAEPTEAGQEETTASGLAYETLRPGDGPQARTGDRVTVHYTAAIEGGDAYDSSRDRGTPWTYTIGDDQAVQGFNEGVAGMKVGELRRLVVPANLAYGALGTFSEFAPGRDRDLTGALQAEELPSIPPNSTIIYEVELIEVGAEAPADAAPEGPPAVEAPDDAGSPPADPATAPNAGAAGPSPG